MKKDYTVTEKAFNKILYIFSILLAFAFCGGLIALAVIDREMFREESLVVIIGTAFFLFIGILAAVMLYRSMRPRVKVSGTTLTCYPRGKRKFTVDASDITARITAPMKDSSHTIGGIAGYMATGGRPLIRENIRYRINGKDIISINTNMKNAQRLDTMIYSLLKEKSSDDED